MRPAARWNIAAAQPQAVAALGAALNLHPVAASVLAARGYADPETVREFLAPKQSSLHDPLLMLDMARAAERVLAAVREQQPILLYGDYDVDGTASIAVLSKALQILGGRVSFHVPDRLAEGYGMRAEIIERAAVEGVRLVISVDTGIRAAEVVRYANAAGVDVIITDHHLPDADIPPAWAVLNPNRPGCGYPFKHLCGAGVTLKLVQAVLALSGLATARQAALLDSFLKPVAIATVADIVPLTGENRVIVQRGLSGLREVRNPGLRSLLRVAGFDDGECPSAHHVAFRIAPRINAAGRMASARDVIELFLTDNVDRAQELAEQLDALNRERQKVESELVEAITAECESLTQEQIGPALVFSGAGWHPGVLGIVASRMVERFSRPVFVLSDVAPAAQGTPGMLSGSGRSIPAFHLLEALESMRGLFARFGGHKQAAGLTLEAENLDEFRQRFADVAGSRLSADDFRPIFNVDAEAHFAQLSDRCIQQVHAIGPFGFGNPPPTFIARRVSVAGPARVIRDGKHFSVPVRSEGRLLWCKAWNFGHRAELLRPGSTLDAIFQLEDDPVSRKRGYDPWCVTLKDIREAQ